MTATKPFAPEKCIEHALKVIGDDLMRPIAPDDTLRVEAAKIVFENAPYVDWDGIIIAHFGRIAPIEAVAFVGTLVGRYSQLGFAADDALEKCVDRAFGFVEDLGDDRDADFHKSWDALDKIYARCAAYTWAQDKLHIPDPEDFSDEDEDEQDDGISDSLDDDVFPVEPPSGPTTQNNAPKPPGG